MRNSRYATHHYSHFKGSTYGYLRHFITVSFSFYICVCVCVCVCVCCCCLWDRWCNWTYTCEKDVKYYFDFIYPWGGKSHRQQERSPWTVIRKLQLIRRWRWAIEVSNIRPESKSDKTSTRTEPDWTGCILSDRRSLCLALFGLWSDLGLDWLD